MIDLVCQAETENVKRISVPSDHTFFLRLTCINCREEFPNAIGVSSDMVVEGLKGATVSVQMKCKGCDRVHDITIQEYDAMHALHSRAPFFVTQGLLRALRASRDGTVIHICDIGADRPVPGYAHYSASKASLVMLVKAMAVELGPELRVLGISPGQVAWPPDYTEELRARLSHKIPLQRVGEPEDIARLVRFAAMEGTYMSGCIIPVDGGLGARYP